MSDITDITGVLQRQAQLRSLEAQRTAQTNLIAIEEQKLALERAKIQRDLDKEHIQQANLAAIKALRWLIAEAGNELNLLSRAQIHDRSDEHEDKDQSLTWSLALIMAKIDLVQVKTDVLEELGDMKELRRVERETVDLIASLSHNGLTSQNPLTSCDMKIQITLAWSTNLTALLTEVKRLSSINELRSQNQSRFKSEANLCLLANNLESFISSLPGTFLQVEEARPKEVFIGRELSPMVSDYWQLRAANHKAPQETPNLAHLSMVIENSDQGSRFRSALLTQLSAQSKSIAFHISEAQFQNEQIIRAREAFDVGEVTAARHLLNDLTGQIYENYGYDEVLAALSSIDECLRSIALTVNVSHRISKLEDLRKSRALPPISELTRTIDKALFQAKSEKSRRRKRLIFLEAILLTGLSIALVAFLYPAQKGNGLVSTIPAPPVVGQPEQSHASPGLFSANQTPLIPPHDSEPAQVSRVDPNPAGLNGDSDRNGEVDSVIAKRLVEVAPTQSRTDSSLIGGVKPSDPALTQGLSDSRQMLFGTIMADCSIAASDGTVFNLKAGDTCPIVGYLGEMVALKVGDSTIFVSKSKLVLGEVRPTAEASNQGVVDLQEHLLATLSEDCSVAAVDGTIFELKKGFVFPFIGISGENGEVLFRDHLIFIPSFRLVISAASASRSSDPKSSG